MKRILTSKTLRVFFTLLLSLPSLVFAQQLLEGQVVDAATGKGIAYTTLTFLSDGQGTITDAKGHFELSIPVEKEADTLVVNHLSYEVYYQPVRTMLTGATSIALKPSFFSISEVRISTPNAFALINEAIERIPENYYAEPLNLHVFQREWLVANDSLRMLEEIAYHALNRYRDEVIKGQIRVLKGRAWADEAIFEKFGKLLANNLNLDSFNLKQDATASFIFPTTEMVGRDKNGFLGSQGNKHYNYTLIGTKKRPNYDVYHIQFEPKEGSRKAWLKGNIYLHTTDYAIETIDVRTTGGDNYVKDLLPLRFRMIAKLAGYSVDVNGLGFRAEFVPVGDKWILHTLHQDIYGSVQHRKNQRIAATYAMDVYVHDIQDKTTFYNRASEYDKVGNAVIPFRRETFWDGYRTLPLSPAIQNAYDVAFFERFSQ